MMVDKAFTKTGTNYSFPLPKELNNVWERLNTGDLVPFYYYNHEQVLNAINYRWECMKGKEKWTLRSALCWHATAYIEKLSEYKVFGTDTSFLHHPLQHVFIGTTKTYYAAKHSDSMKKAKERLKEKYNLDGFYNSSGAVLNV